MSPTWKETSDRLTTAQEAALAARKELLDLIDGVIGDVVEMAHDPYWQRRLARTMREEFDDTDTPPDLSCAQAFDRLVAAQAEWRAASEAALDFIAVTPSGVQVQE